MASAHLAKTQNLVATRLHEDSSKYRQGSGYIKATSIVYGCSVQPTLNILGFFVLHIIFYRSNVHQV